MTKGNLACVLALCVLICLLDVVPGKRQASAFGQENVEAQADELHRQNRAALPWVAMILLAVFLLLVLSLRFHLRSDGAEAQDALPELYDKRRQLLDELKRTETLYADGKIGEEAYLTQCQHRKQQLVELTLLCNLLFLKSTA